LASSEDLGSAKDGIDKNSKCYNRAEESPDHEEQSAQDSHRDSANFADAQFPKCAKSSATTDFALHRNSEAGVRIRLSSAAAVVSLKEQIRSARMDRNLSNELSRAGFFAGIVFLKQRTSNLLAISRTCPQTEFFCGRGAAIRSPLEDTP
jgi:hypothetical protein